MTPSPPRPLILWKQVLGLTAVQGAIALMWVVYGAYLPQLLAQFGLPIEAAIALVAIENGLAVVIEPIMGGISDRSLRWIGSRFPAIAVGVIAAATLFIVIPLIGLFGNLASITRLGVVGVLVTWSVAMTIFHSPVLSLLRNYSSVPQLPIANSLLMLTSGLIGTARPIANQSILSLGPVTTFTIGSIVLLGATTVLRAVDPPRVPTVASVREAPRLAVSAVVLAAGLGASIGWGTHFVMDTFVKVFQSRLPDADVGAVMFWVAVGLAVLAIPAGLVASQVGNRHLVFLSLILAIVFLQLMVFSSAQLILAVCIVGLVVALSLVTNGVFPLVLSLVPPSRAGLITGMYLGGGAAATSLFGVFFNPLQQLNVAQAALLAAIAFFLATLCVFATGQAKSEE
ncbi:MFS transporter [Oscillatoria sp. FACHB-1407]|uniref:MFS transporter n=1 Tax=Oscillatoria sp. FACHB-1407 TaxID=2692847 RepID=UPI001688BBD7|nr:MFS transporter [Oscillatoria sp. FACHB-1407]MBD2462429.1 MFS transporter [Oscillatoria sp. FACHB-1407]